ncbi:MAG: TetR/AcrR family transcriptional regulator [Actinobacteria bacterium]|nr:TetR/AcrR family transcriptional regulator [Actinomycetota bacterium]
MSETTVTARRSQTRERLMDAAVALFAAKGVLGASVEEICERAEFTRGAFYSNFADKDDLCLAVLNRHALRELEATEKAVASIGEDVLCARTIDEVIELALSVFLATQPRSSEDLVAGMELRLYAVRAPALRQPLLALNERMGEQIGDLLGGVVDRVGLRLQLPMEEALDLLHAVYLHSGINALLQGLEPDDESRRRQLTELLKSLVTDREEPR